MLVLCFFLFSDISNRLWVAAIPDGCGCVFGSRRLVWIEAKGGEIGLASRGKRDDRGIARGWRTDITGDTAGVEGTCRAEDGRTEVEGDHTGCRSQGNDGEEQKCRTVVEGTQIERTRSNMKNIAKKWQRAHKLMDVVGNGNVGMRWMTTPSKVNGRISSFTRVPSLYLFIWCPFL
eukprot:Gb_41685 [translate_table: standard]